MMRRWVPVAIGSGVVLWVVALLFWVIEIAFFVFFLQLCRLKKAFERCQHADLKRHVELA